MSTVPSPTDPSPAADGPADRPAGETAEAPAAAHAAPAAPAAPAARPGSGSGMLPRILTIVYALVMTPIATALLSYGGTRLARLSFSAGSYDISEMLASTRGTGILVTLVLGLLLLASVVVTGIASSAGLVAVGVLGLVSLVLAVFPIALQQLYGLFGSLIPFEVLDGFVYGLPLVLHPLLGGLGLSLVIARRRPDPHIILSVLGVVVIPLVLLVGAGLLFRGMTDGAVYAAMTFMPQIPLAAAVLTVLGVLLLSLGAAATRWSPYALVLPALVVLAMTLLSFVHVLPEVSHLLWSTRAGATAATFLMAGGGPAVALTFLIHTGVLGTVRSRARRAIRRARPVGPEHGW